MQLGTNWGTPASLLKELLGDRKFVDVTPYPRPLDFDALTINWRADCISFCNPPYCDLYRKWAAKISQQAQLGRQIVLIMPARISANYVHEYLLPHMTEIKFIRGRVKFLDLENVSDGAAEHNTAPFDLMACYFNCSSGNELFNIKLSK